MLVQDSVLPEASNDALDATVEAGLAANNETHAGCQASAAGGLPSSHHSLEAGILKIPPKPTGKMAQLLKDKEKEWAAAIEKKGPLQLLDLPVDVLKEIIKEVTHTNDLTSLALTHSSLNSLAIPYIYSRFDIVWPETQVTTDPRTGVDALTYGLSTLVLSDVKSSNCTCCGKPYQHVQDTATDLCERRTNNNFAQYIRKFSLGNGPTEWVQEYLISKESGKMLGTLVALAIRKMVFLETFVWDMPTGILRDVWLALSSLGRICVYEDPRLQRIHIRCHDNKSTTSPVHTQITGALAQSHSPIQAAGAAVPQQSTSAASGGVGGSTDALGGYTRESLLAKSYLNVEHPNFSILPSLKSITVLNIDELAYLDELSVLIERSIERLRELRLGAANLGHAKNWSVLDSTSLPNATNAGMTYAVAGGMLGMALCKIHDCRSQSRALKRNAQSGEETLKQESVELVADNFLGSPSSHIVPTALAKPTNFPSEEGPETQDSTWLGPPPHLFQPISIPTVSNATATGRMTEPVADSLSSITALPRSQSEHATAHELLGGTIPIRSASLSTSSLFQNRVSWMSPTSGHKLFSDTTTVNGRSSKHKKLRLEILELEKIPLCVPILQKTINWTVLTTLTLLNCDSDEEFWKALRRMHVPRANISSTLISPTSNPVHSPRPYLKKAPSTPLSEYTLRLKKVHTNNVSPSLIAFLKDALAPNTLEWMFLQDGWGSVSKVTVESIYKGPLRRHRDSLKKVMIDSGGKRSSGSGRNTKWKKWMISQEVLSFVTSGKMSALRELAIAVEYKHWHFFLQRLPQIPHLRSLYIPFMADHVHGQELESKELALQVVDIVTLRPEIELCYIGIATKCFEILENKQSNDPLYSNGDSSSNPASNSPEGVAMEETVEDSDSDDDNDDDDDDDEVNGQDGIAPVEQEANESDSPDDSQTNSDNEDGEFAGGKKRARLQLREILFYDDKVSIFKARHGQL